MTRSKYQQEYDALPDWAKGIIGGLQEISSHGIGGPAGREHVSVEFAKKGVAWKFHDALSDAISFAGALTAPYPPPAPPVRELRAFNLVEMVADDEEECVFDQPCAFGHRVGFHAVYCHNEAWPHSPRKCRRNRSDHRHEDCPGFVANPDYKPAEGR